MQKPPGAARYNGRMSKQNDQQLWDKIKDVRVAMLTTQEDDGSLRSRPMYTQQAEYSGELWFFTADDSGKVDEIRRERDVNLAYVEPKDDLYVSVSGKAQVVKDAAKMDELWNPALKAWFNGGRDDPHLALLRITVVGAEYWDDNHSKMGQLFGMAKAAVTNDTYTGTDHGVVKPQS